MSEVPLYTVGRSHPSSYFIYLGVSRMYEINRTLSFGYDSSSKVCSDFRCVWKTPEYLIQLPGGMRSNKTL